MKSIKNIKPSAEKPEEYQYSPAVKRLLGSVKLPPDYDYKKDMMEELYKKYMKQN